MAKRPEELEGPDKTQELGTLGDYKLLREVGRGGMGVVYEAWQNSMNRRVALKVLPGAFAADSRTVARFVREAQVAGKLNHPNVVSVYGMGVEEETPFYSMELVEGETLAEVLERSKLSSGDGAEEERCRVLTTVSGLLRDGTDEVRGEPRKETSDATPGSQARTSLDTDHVSAEYFRKLAGAFAAVADGLEHAHQRGVIHRDLKPSNLILDHLGHLRILDFGLARIEGQESLTATGDFLGTVMYVSPEQAMARRVAVDHRTDIYSLGATLYQMLTWQPPFRGKTHQDTLSQIIFRDPPAPRRAYPNIPKDLETIVLKCLRKNPRERYGTAQALAQDLRRYARGAPIEARPQPRWKKAARVVWRQKLRVGVAMLLVALGALVAHFALDPEPERDRLIWKAPVAATANAVSPDGRLLSYHRDSRLWVRNWTSGEDTPFGKKEGLPNGSVFSPDSKEIAYAWLNQDRTFELRIASLDRSEDRILWSGQGTCRPWSWSGATDELLVLVSTDDETSDLVLVSVADGSTQTVKSGLGGRTPMGGSPFFWNTYWSPLRSFWIRARLSPDARSIAYELNESIFLLARKGGWKTETHLVSGRLLAWAPDGKNLLFARKRSGTWDLWSVNVTGDRTPRLLRRGIGKIEALGPTAGGSLCYSDERSLQFSPSPARPSAHVAIASLDLENARVVVLPAPVSQRTTISESAPRWARDGQQLAYRTQRDSGKCSVSIYDLNTKNVRDIPLELQFMEWPCFSPDGERIAVVGSDLDTQYGIYQVDALGGEATLIHGWREERARVSAYRLRKLEWFPDGKSILYSKLGVGGARIVQLDLLSGDEKELAFAVSLRMMGIRTALSPDGGRIAFTTYEQETRSWVLKVLALGTGDARALHRINVREFPKGLTWTPDGTQLLLGTIHSLYLIPARGGEVRKIDLNLDGCADLTMHPDGRRLAFSTFREPLTYEIRMLENCLAPLDEEGEQTQSGEGSRREQNGSRSAR